MKTTLAVETVAQARFVWAVGAYSECFPDMPADLGDNGCLVLWDRQERKVVSTVSREYAQILCLERTDKPDHAPLTALESWLNTMKAGDLSSEGIPDTR
jgi:hypothetical protein